MANVTGTISKEAAVSGGEKGHEELRRKEIEVLSARASDHPPGVWVYGNEDEYTGIEHARAMHAAAGQGQEFVEMDGGHEGYGDEVLPRIEAVVKEWSPGR